MVFGGPALIGSLSTDNGKTVAPAMPLTGPGGGLGILLCVAAMGLTACASYIDYGNGRYGVTRVSEERSPFGTNAGFAFLENCEGFRQNPGATLEFKDCRQITPITPIQSQGQGGQVVGGAFTGIGMGVGGAMVNTGSSVIQSVTTVGGGHGKGH